MLRGLALVILLAGACTSSTAGTDLGIVQPGCHAPSACFKLGGDCGCGRAELDAVCKTCDPALTNCVCDRGSTCAEAATVCIGRGVTVCGGIGARCLPMGTSCSTGQTGTPPQLVGSGSEFAPRCQFTDDVCCPGVIVDLGVVD